MITALIRGAAAVLLAGALAATAAAAPAGAQAKAQDRERDGGGTLVLVGGGLKDGNAEIYGEIVRRAGGPVARFGVITAASVPPSQDPDAGTPDAANSEANGAFYAGLLTRYGAGSAEWLPIDLDHPDAADSPELAAKVRTMTGFFFGGGDQYRYVRTMIRDGRDSPVLAAIRDRLEHGAVVAGSSAGAQIQAGPDMVTGGESYEGLRDGARPGYFDDSTVLAYHPAGGFGFFRHGLLDTHFSVYGRQGRAVRLAADTGHDRVFGLDENTALLVTGVGTRREDVRVIGEHGVSVLDLSRARVTRNPWSIDGVSWSHLTRGDRWTPQGVRTAPGKRPDRPEDRTARPASQDVFDSPAGTGDGYELFDVARDLATAGRSRSVTGYTLETGPRFAVTLTEPHGFRSRTDGSFTGLRLAVAPA
ncbi:cyanophycinase [Streptosporangium sp. NPDC048047]|uniref:cyanophycinase n=1 Tax=Streptosporangium sp. NPDC048047 TaxID=3155748 RepID=UPI00341E88F9